MEGPGCGIPGVENLHLTPTQPLNGILTGIDEIPRRRGNWQNEIKITGRKTGCVEETNKLQERGTDSSPANLEEVIREIARHALAQYIQIIITHRERKAGMTTGHVC